MKGPVVKLIRTRRLMRHYARRYGASPWRQVAEMARLWAANGIGPLEYYLLGLFRPWVPWSEKVNTVSQARYWELIQIINPPEVRRIATNKMASYAILRAHGLPTPRIYGAYGPRGRSFDGGELSRPGHVAALAAAHGLGTVCFKPLSAWSGQGVRKVRFDGEAVEILPDGPRMPLDAFCRGLPSGATDTFLIQDAVDQHPDVARFHPASLNTMRVWMYRRAGGEWEMGPGNLRMGVGGSVVDNTSAGGIGAAIDADTGRLGVAVRRGLDPGSGVLHEEYALHPTTGETIDGAVLPMWAETRELCRRVCEAFPFFGLMGLDVGFGVEHPWVIEVEADPHAMIQVYVGKGLKPDLDEIAARARAARSGRTLE